MEVDTDAAVAVISEETYRALWNADSRPHIHVSTKNLKSYTGSRIAVEGETSVQVEYKGQSKMLNLVVVRGSSPSLLDRDWLEHIRLDWKEFKIMNAATNKFLDDLIANRHSVQE